MRHAPAGYDCPFCRIVRHESSGQTEPDEIVFEDEATVAFVSSSGFGRRPGHCLVVPRAHWENLYDLPPPLLAAVYASARRIALAYRCDDEVQGTSTRQHNEPAGNQDVWHFHVHVFPRYDGDDLYGSTRTLVGREIRREHARRLRELIAYSNKSHL